MIVSTAEQLRGAIVLADDGSSLGEVADVYLDDETGRPTWVTVEIGRLGHKSLAPVSAAVWEGGRLRLPYRKKEIKRAPHANPGVHLSRSLELRLLEHYGLAGGATLAEVPVPVRAPRAWRTIDPAPGGTGRSEPEEARGELDPREAADRRLGATA